MRLFCTLLGTLLIAVAAAGLGVIAFGPRELLQVAVSRAIIQPEPPPPTTEVVMELPPFAGGQPITRLELPRVSLNSEVVPAKMVELNGALSWLVPAHKAGHAEFTAGAGDAGNAVLLGHVASVNAGNVFKDLSRLKPGDPVRIFAEDGDAFDYVVTETKTVPRTDVSVLDPTETPTVTLITCTGQWLGWDYSHRLVVRAERTTPAGA